MFGSSLIVFRETLEAAIFIGIVAAATQGLPKRNRWLIVGISAGLVGSLIVAMFFSSLAELAEGTGQERFNAIVLGIAVLMLGWHNISMASHSNGIANKTKEIGLAIKEGSKELSAMAIVVAIAVLREGSETVLFLQGIASAGNDGLLNVFGGGAFGLLGGVALGMLIYVGLLRIPLRKLFSVTSALLLLLAAGLASQMARVLIQGDLISTMTTPLWNSSNVLSMDSFLGSTLHILIGYDAQPSGMQVIFYITTLVFISAGTALVRRQNRTIKLEQSQIIQ